MGQEPEIQTDGSPSWNQFRGGSHHAIADGQQPPIEFGEEQNLAWKVELPGQAWSSPVVMGQQIWFTNAITKTGQSEKEEGSAAARTCC